MRTNLSVVTEGDLSVETRSASMRTDSDSENDMAAEEKRSHAGHGRTLLKRVFSTKKTSWPGWWYEAAGLLETAGLEQYMSGSNSGAPRRAVVIGSH